MSSYLINKKLLNKHDKQVMLEIGFLLGELNYWDQSEKIFRALLAIDSGLIPALLGLGNLMLIQKKYYDAELIYREILNRNPNEHLAKAYLGELLLLTGQTLEARDLLLNLVKIDSQSTQGQMAQALLLLHKITNKSTSLDNGKNQ